MPQESAPVFSVPWLGLLFAFVGLAWCGYISFPTAHAPLLCETSGCALLLDGKILGISLWWIGGAYFLLQSLLCLRGKRIAAWRLSRFALLLDSILLLIMFFTGPCFNCLVAALLFAVLCIALRPPAEGWFLENLPSPLLVPLWLGLFLGNTALAFDEILPQLTIGSNNSKEIRVYFAPSCTYCREALVLFENSAALYPVSEKEGDIESVLRLRSLLQAQVPMKDAITRCLSPNEPLPQISELEYFLFQLQLLRNKATVFRNKTYTLPLIMVNGMPRNTISHSQKNTTSTQPAVQDAAALPKIPAADGTEELSGNMPNVLQDIEQNLGNGLKTCGGAESAPCPE